MWAPADLFTHPFSVLTMPLRRLFTYLYEHPLALGFLLAVGCLALAFASHRPWMAWTFVVLAWALSLVASAWPVVATADSAVDRARDIGPWILELVRTVRG